MAIDMKIQYLDFQKTRKLLIQKIKDAKNIKTRVALQILLIQLVNGARISEAYDAYYQFVATGEREVRVLTRKKRRPDYRTIYIPPEVAPINIRVNIDSVKRVCKRELKTNTHSLRYAYITFAGADLKLPPQIVAKITHHSKPELIEYYTHSLLAQKIQKKIATGEE